MFRYFYFTGVPQIILFSRIPYPHSRDRAGLYSEDACYNDMIEALDSEHNLFFAVANSFGFIFNLITLMFKLRFTRNILSATM